MPIVEEMGHAFRFKVTKGLLEFFDVHRIRTTAQKGVHRWSEGDIILAASTSRFESHTMHLSGQHVMQFQAFSYAFSALDPYLTAGRYCSISWNVRSMGPQHATHFVTSSEILYRPDGYFADTFSEFGATDWKFHPNPQRGRIQIGHDVWVGQDVLIRSGVSIGTGAVIGAGAVVVKDVAPYEVVGGVPARHIKYRFDEDVAKKLLDLKWWRYAIPQLPKASWDRPTDFINEMGELIDSGQAKPFSSDLGSVRSIIEQIG